MDSKQFFSGKPQEVTTDADKERGPDLFLAMRTGQTSQLVFLGWLEGGKYNDQPVFFSPLLKRAFALPAHAILLDKLANVAKFTPVIVSCTKAPEKGSTGAARYTVQSFPTIDDAGTVDELSAERAAFMEEVAKVRGLRRAGGARRAAGPGMSQTDVAPGYDF